MHFPMEKPVWVFNCLISPLGFPSMRYYLALPLLFLASLMAIHPARAAEEEEEEKPQKRIICDRKGNYPTALVDDSREGWVDLRFTMKADGSFTDVEVISAFGEPYFAETAQKAMSTCRYEHPELIAPAGQEARNLRTRYYFRLEPPSKGSTETVYVRLKEAQRLLKDGQVDAAEAALLRVEKNSRNLYEFSHLMIMRAAVAVARGNSSLALSYLDGISENKRFIEKREFSQLLRMRLSLELQEGHYVDAQRTADEMAEKSPRDGDEKLLAGLANLKKLVTSGSPFSVSGQIPVNCHPAFCEPDKPEWSYAPYNRTVSLADIQGQLDTVFLRCNKKTMTAKAEAGITWTIPKSWGQCEVHVLGKPGTKFTLIDETL
ncbi:energy transducer TonB [Azospirillum sp. RU37A]|nr:energy transducer TonB [Azospirillum sp. RU37A]